jgi:hypothetical protein
VTTTLAGRDSRTLVDTAAAAYSLGMKPGSFRGWAVRHHIKPTGSRPNPNGGQATALWDLADIAQALDKHSVAA